MSHSHSQKKSQSPKIYEYCVWMWYYNVWNLDWPNIYRLKMNNDQHKAKLAAIDTYTSAIAPCGQPWSGVLPKVFINANSWDKELYFRIK